MCSRGGRKSKNILDGFFCWKCDCFCSVLAFRVAYSFGNRSSIKLLNSKQTFGQPRGCGHLQTLHTMFPSSGTSMQTSQYTGKEYENNAYQTSGRIWNLRSDKVVQKYSPQMMKYFNLLTRERDRKTQTYQFKHYHGHN